jgi:hypothetical protein
MFLTTLCTHVPTSFVATISIAFNLHDIPQFCPLPHPTNPKLGIIFIAPKHHCQDIQTLLPPQHYYKFFIVTT